MLEVAGAYRFARTRWAFRCARILSRAGLFRPAHPITTLRDGRDVRRWGPLAGAVRLAARRWPDAVGLVDDRGALTFAELDLRSNALAWAWRGQGIRQDSAIGLLAGNHRGLLDALFAAAKLGAQVLALPTDVAGEPLAPVLQREGVTAIVYDQEFAPSVADLPERVARYLAWSAGRGAVTSLDELIAAAPPHEPPAPAEPGGLTFLGTGDDGSSRGVPCRVVASYVAAQFLDRMPLPAGWPVLVAVPLVNTYGLAPTLVALSIGSTIVLQRDTNGQRMLTNIANHSCAAAVLTPHVLRELLAAQGPAPSTLRILISSGGVLDPELGNRAGVLLGDVVHNWYCTDDSLLAAVATPADWRAAPGTIGRPPFGGRLGLYADGGRVEEPGRLGYVYVANPFAGTTPVSAAAQIDGLRPTGAVGYLDRAGRLFLRNGGSDPARRVRDVNG
jgi:fatty-acyl-CoA synthase